MTTNDLKESKPVTPLNWAGEPMTPEQAYGGKPEHWPITEITKRARKGIKAMTEQRLAQLREGMRKAREAKAKIKLSRDSKGHLHSKTVVHNKSEKATKTEKSDTVSVVPGTDTGTEQGPKPKGGPITTSVLQEIKATPLQ